MRGVCDCRCRSQAKGAEVCLWTSVVKVGFVLQETVLWLDCLSKLDCCV